jgi:pyruvate/2-oxoglutarate/acetoin dehydrogenase E1 component
MTNQNEVITVARAICNSQGKLLRENVDCVLFGLGVNDPKRVFGTTENLVEEFGNLRVFETPTAENSSLGMAVGLAITGFKPIVVHQRLDFFLLAMDQLVNAAAKWRYMFGDQYNTAMIIRLIVGRGWGQGPTHSQNLHSMFAHIPNLRVFFPTFAQDFETIFDHAFRQKYPIIVIEDRWIHQSEVNPLESKNELKFGSARLVRQGKDLTLISFGFNTILGIKIVDFYAKRGIDIELIDLVSIKPFDVELIIESCAKTRSVVIVDSGFEFASIASYISDVINRSIFGKLKKPIRCITAGDVSEPTSHGIIDKVKINASKIAYAIALQADLSGELDFSELITKLVDVPDESFRGPF